MLVNGTNNNELNPSQCFSILFRGDWTLDLMMLSNNRDEVLDAIDQILETYQTQKRRVSNDVLLLRYHWLDAVSDKVRLGYAHFWSVGPWNHLSLIPVGIIGKGPSCQYF